MMSFELPPFRHPCATDAELRAWAKMPTLTLPQAVSLIQGFLPRGRSCAGLQYIDDYAQDIQALLGGVERAEISMPISPEELVQFCCKYGVRIPAQIADEAMSKNSKRSSATMRPPLTDEFVHPPKKKGRPHKQAAVYLHCSTADKQFAKVQDAQSWHRPTRVQGREASVQLDARKVALNYIKEYGRMPKGKEITSALSKSLGRHEADLRRRFAINTLLTPDEIRAARQAFRKSKYR